MKQSSLFLLAPDQWSHCPAWECDLNLTWIEFCFREDFQPARRKTHYSKLLYHCRAWRQRFAYNLCWSTGFYCCLLSASLYHRASQNTFTALPAGTLSYVCNFLLLRFLLDANSLRGQKKAKQNVNAALNERGHCLLLGKRSSYTVMIALTWCAQRWTLYTCTKLFCPVGSGASELVFRDCCILLNPLILTLFFSPSFNPKRCFLTFTAVSLTASSTSASQNQKAADGLLAVGAAMQAEESWHSRDLLGPGLML